MSQREPKTKTGKRLGSRMWASKDNGDLGAVVAFIFEDLAKVEDEARADADAQIAALREALVWALRNNGGEVPADDLVGYAKALEVAVDTASAAKAHDAALVKRVFDAVREAGVSEVFTASDGHAAVQMLSVEEIITKARALLRDTE